MLYPPEYFNCNHKNLTKSNMSNSTYVCNKCEKEFLIIPAKTDPITMPFIKPRGPKRDFPPGMPGRPFKPEYIKPF